MEMKEELKDLRYLKESQKSNKFLMDIIKEVAKLVTDISIYPSKKEVYGIAEAYLKKNHHEFFNKFSEIQWTAYYNEHICKQLLEQIHSFRGSLASKTRDVIFATFGKMNLPSIKSNADSSQTITFIVKKVFSGKQYTNAEFAFIMAICKTLLNPKYDSLQLKEKTMKRKVKYYLKKIKKELPLDDDDDDNSNNEESVKDEDVNLHRILFLFKL
ncbi:hypothetical protein GLOIN_2v1834793 [Rhizophagus clarus]|uniref:Uncharacterized protein n=1 Tax=Rhizophagus clarus TaxID=94130 RepID=A0A8H3LIZ3_9GLOM|nr:hypothetical protein GLOIN_2v1834793 [Rhizophagus clarus]